MGISISKRISKDRQTKLKMIESDFDEKGTSDNTVFTLRNVPLGLTMIFTLHDLSVSRRPLGLSR